MPKKIIVIAGPTASGKTALSVELALHLKCPIISADSRQFYKEMSIGTAKPTKEEQRNIPHFFIDSHSVSDPISSGQFESEALELIAKLHQEHDVVLLVGGSGMFIDAVIFGTDQLPHEPAIRDKYNDIWKSEGTEAIGKLLAAKDEATWKKIDQNNPVRIIRALEIIELTNKKLSELPLRQMNKRNFETCYVVLDLEREHLYERINQRVVSMFENGLVDEVSRLLPLKNTQPLNTVGYKEVFLYLEGQITLLEAIALVQQNTRRYAKRQLTWFRRNPNAFWVPYDTKTKMLASILEHCY